MVKNMYVKVNEIIGFQERRFVNRKYIFNKLIELLVYEEIIQVKLWGFFFSEYGVENIFERIWEFIELFFRIMREKYLREVVCFGNGDL